AEPRLASAQGFFVAAQVLSPRSCELLLFLRNCRRLHGRPQDPGREFVFAKTVELAFAALARGDLDDAAKNLLAHLVDGLATVEDAAAVDVHVVAHVLVHRGIGSELDRRRRLAAVDRSAPRRKADKVCSACYLAGR